LLTCFICRMHVKECLWYIFWQQYAWNNINIWYRHFMDILRTSGFGTYGYPMDIHNVHLGCLSDVIALFGVVHVPDAHFLIHTIVAPLCSVNAFSNNKSLKWYYETSSWRLLIAQLCIAHLNSWVKLIKLAPSHYVTSGVLPSSWDLPAFPREGVCFLHRLPMKD
jgi:hypothetical protein